MKQSEKDNDPLVPNKKSVLSVLVSMMVLLPSLYMLVRQKAWQVGKKSCQDWLEKNHWDVKVRQIKKITVFILFPGCVEGICLGEYSPQDDPLRSDWVHHGS
jgi:hypothetical protein